MQMHLRQEVLDEVKQEAAHKEAPKVREDKAR